MVFGNRPLTVYEGVEKGMVMDFTRLRSGWVPGLQLGILSACVAGWMFTAGCGTTASTAGTDEPVLSGDAWVMAGFEDELKSPSEPRRPVSPVMGSEYGGGPQEEDEDLDLESLLDEIDDSMEVETEQEAAEESAPATGGQDEGQVEDTGGVEEAAEKSDDLDDALRGLQEPAEEEVEEEPAQPETRAAPPGGNVGAGELIRRLGLSESARKEEAKELVRQARAHMANAELLKADAALEEAVRLDPDNVEAQRARSEVRLLLGDPRGMTSTQSRDILARQQVAREQARVEINRLIAEGSRQAREKQYAKAIQSYERALESIHNFPFDLNLDDLEREVSAGLESLKQKKRVHEEEEREEFRKMVDEQRLKERSEDLRIVENQIRQLRRKARAAEDAHDYERAITLYERILSISPRDKDAISRLHYAQERRHLTKLQTLRDEYEENYDMAIMGIQESSIVYQQIFRYPDSEEWQRLAPRVVPLQEAIAANETEVEKEIKRRLGAIQSLSFEQETPFREVLDTLQRISQINFVLTREGAEVEDETIQLAEYDNLPLQNLLRLILQAISAKAGQEFSYAIKEGAVVIGPRESLKEREYLHFYDISDLVATRPDFAAPALALDALAGRTSTEGALIDFGEEEEATTGKLDREKLLELIQRELASGEQDPLDVGVSMMAGKLAARTTLENHLKLAQLLEQFRKSTGAMITVESRFLDIQDNFLEDIGVNMGSGGNTFLPNTIPDIDGAGTSVSPGWEYVNPQGTYNARIASIGELSMQPGSSVNPFQLTNAGGGAYQLNVLKTERYQLEALLTGVAKDQEIRRLSSPRVTAFNGQTSHTMVVEQSAYIQDLEVNQTGVIPVINPVIGVLNSGSILEVRPTLSYDRRYVVLEIQPTLAQQLESDVAILNLSGSFTVVPVELPVLAVTKIKTTVTVPDGGTVLVGGLKREIHLKDQIGVPGLLDIPLINLLFGRRGVSTVRSSLFVLINAKITVVHEEEARLFGT